MGGPGGGLCSSAVHCLGHVSLETSAQCFSHFNSELIMTEDLSNEQRVL